MRENSASYPCLEEKDLVGLFQYCLSYPFPCLCELPSSPTTAPHISRLSLPICKMEGSHLVRGPVSSLLCLRV